MAAPIEQFGLTTRSAQLYAQVARVYESTHRLNLSWTHHMVATGIVNPAARMTLLNRAKTEG